MKKQSFNGHLTAFAGDSRENDPFWKITIKSREESTLHAMLSPFQEEDEGLDGAYKWSNSPGYGKATFTLTTPIRMNVQFDSFYFVATLVSVAMTKKATPDLGTIVEYAFNFEKEPAQEDHSFWMAYLKTKEVQDEAPEDPTGRQPKPRTVEYSVVMETLDSPSEVASAEAADGMDP